MRRQPEDLQRIREDLDVLSEIGHRYAGSEGERAMLHQVKSRMTGDAKPQIEGFVAYTSPAFVVGTHSLALVGAGLLGFFHPLAAAILCALVTVSLAAEGSGRLSIMRWVLPKSASYNLHVARGASKPLGSLVIAASLDTPRWRPERPAWLIRPLKAVLIAAIVVTAILVLRSMAEPWGRPTQGMYIASLIVLGAAVAFTAVAHRRVGGIREDASGPAALLALSRRLEAAPVENLDVWLLFTGCSHAYQNGMHAFLAMRGSRLIDPVLVLAVDEPGRGELGAVVSEGPLWPQHHRPTGPALVERLRWAGATIPAVDHVSVTDARAALLWGYRALALVGGEGESTPESTAEAVDVLESLVRLYAEDLARLPTSIPLAIEAEASS